MSDTPTLSGVVIGQAERATRAVLDSLLAPTGTTFEQWVALRVSTDAASQMPEPDLVQRMAVGLRVPGATALVAIDQLVALGLMEREGDAVALTAAGVVRHDDISAALDDVVERLYGGLSDDDLATAGRVLAVVTQRANAELAG